MQRQHAFTLIELLVVIAIIGILAALLFPVFSKAKQKAQGVTCLNSGKQMMQAVTMYTGDNHDFYPPNPDGGTAVPGHNWCSGDARVGGMNEFDTEILRDASRSLLVGYLGNDPSPFRCPGDKRTGLYQGTNLTQMGKTVPAARSFSMSQAVGTMCAEFDATGPGDRGTHSGVPRLSVNGPWLNNQFNHRRGTTWRTYGKFSSVFDPGPSKLWVLVDEDPKGINDAAFAFGMERPIWYDVPGTFHNSGCGFAFADGHSEFHKWKMQGPKKGRRFVIVDPADREDWLWMQARTSAAINPAPAAQ